MKTIGIYLRQAREGQNISYKELSRHTKIKPEFLEAIENSDWQKLPELPVLVGFVKSICDELNINREQAVALLRRDYPPQKVSLNPHRDVKREIRIGQRALWGIFSVIAIVLMSAYLYSQYREFTSPPHIAIISPAENELVSSHNITVRGTTDSTATVKINGQPALVDKNGNFATDIEVVAETKSIEVKALSRTGRESNVSRTIQVELKK